MGIFGGLFRALGFESEDDESKPVKKKTKKTEPKASYNLKKGKIEKPDVIDGVKVLYVEGIFSAKKALEIYKKDEPVLVNVQEAEDKERILGYLEGYVEATGGNTETIEEKTLIILLPEGVEIE